MVPVASAPRVVIAGGGPGGLAAASLLREAGATVTVLERMAAGIVDDARRAGIVAHHSGWDVLRRAGGSSLLDETRTAISASEHLMSLRSIDDVLGGAVVERGGTLLHGMSVAGIVDDGTKVTVSARNAATDAVEQFEADWFIDATGGKSGIAELHPKLARIEQSGPMNLLPSRRGFLAVQADHVPGRGLGWQAADGAFAINNPVEGRVIAYTPFDRASGVDQAQAGTALLRSLDIDPSTAIGTPYTFTARQQLAEHAVHGRSLLIGDSVGTVMPATQMGTTLALLDAERAASTIIGAHAAETAAEAQRLLDRFDAETVLMHRAFIR